jgi:hypothetical protein
VHAHLANLLQNNSLHWPLTLQTPTPVLPNKGQGLLHPCARATRQSGLATSGCSCTHWTLVVALD